MGVLEEMKEMSRAKDTLLGSVKNGHNQRAGGYSMSNPSIVFCTLGGHLASCVFLHVIFYVQNGKN